MTKILIAEDDLDSQYMLKQLLKSYGHDIIVADNGEQALKSAKLSPPELIISDIMMPIMNGFKLCREVKKDKTLKNIPFIFYTATFIEKMDEKLGMSLGASRFIIKPMDGTQFIQILDQVLAEHCQGILPVPDKPREDDITLLEMYENSLTYKLSQTVEKLEAKQKELQKSKQRLKEAQEIAQVGHWELDLKDNTLQWSDEMYRIFGQPPQKSEATYDTFLAMVHPDDRAYVDKSYKESLAKKTQYDIDHRLLLKDNIVKWVHERCQTLYDDNGEPICSIGTVQDITERKQIEKALQASEEKYRHLFENFLDVYYQADHKGIITLISPSVRKIYGYAPDEVIGRPMKEFIIDPLNQKEFLRQLSLNGIVEHFEAQSKHKDGSVIWISTNAKSLNDKNKNLIGIEGITRDVTKQKLAELEQKRLQTLLRQSQKMEAIGTLAGGIAHDFNNILSVILGYSELARGEIDDSKKLNHDLGKIFNAALRAKDLVSQILLFSRKSDQDLKPIRVQLVLKESLKFLRASIPTTIEITQNIDPDCEPVLADSTQMHQIIMNLCTNAYYSMRDSGGIISVSLKTVELFSEDMITMIDLEPGDYVELAISDTGCGISNDDLERIFEPYYTSKPKGEGTGLGLAVVHGIVNSCHGRIIVHSKQGHGTTFQIYLPIIKEPEEIIQKKGIRALPTGNERIIIVDDDNSIAQMLKMVLEKLGYKVTALTDSLNALALFRETPDDFDLVLTDMTMPDMSGDQLAKEILKINPEIPIIICTGFNENITQEKAIAIGVKGLLMKPVTSFELTRTIRTVLEEGSV